MNASRSVVTGFVLLLTVGCHTPQRGACVVRTEGTQGVSRLYRQANAETANLGPGKLLCDVPRQGRSRGDRCEDVDDLDALLGRGKSCGPGGWTAVTACPVYATERIKEQELNGPPVCGGGCPSMAVSFREASGSVTHVTFYDDPGCHPESSPCGASARSCYYRVLSVTSELRDE